jgi:hypothetical protein
VAKLNKQTDFEGLRIYGLLTDLTLFRFYSYDPQNKVFCQDETFVVDAKRESFSSSMMNGMCLFSCNCTLKMTDAVVSYEEDF